MISDREVAIALGWKQKEVSTRIKVEGQLGGEFGLAIAPFDMPIKKWHDENGQHHPLRPFTASYDVVMDECTKRGLNVAFRSDSDVVFVWTGNDKSNVSQVQGLPLVEGFCIAMLHQLGRLDKLPKHIQANALYYLNRSKQPAVTLEQSKENL